MRRPCPRCKVAKPESDYYANAHKPAVYCRPCEAEVKFESRLRRCYGITRDDYERMVSEQEGVCAICELPDPHRRLAVDHCHDTGQVRGLLCRGCNQAIGALGDTPAALERAVAYLYRTTPTPKESA